MKPGDEVLFSKNEAQTREKASVQIKAGSSAAHYSFAFSYHLEAIASNAGLVSEARIYSIRVVNASMRKIGARTCRPCNTAKSLDGYAHETTRFKFD